jgi:predicted dehydrogenase
MAETVRVAVVTQAGGAHLSSYFGSLAAIDEAPRVAVCDPDGACEAEARKLLGDKFAGFYRSEDELHREFDPELAIVTLEPRHTPPVVDRLLDAGCHIVCEKPGCTKAEDFAPLVRKAEMKHKHLMLALANRPYPAVQEARRLIRRGIFGKLYGLNLYIVADQARLTDPAYHKSWPAQKARAGGGYLAWLGIHWLDLATYITGLKAEAVTGFIDNVGGQPLDVEDSAAVAIRYSDRVLGSIQAGYYLDRKHCDNVAKYQSYLQIWGEHGWLRLQMIEDEPLRWYSSQESGPVGVKEFAYPKGGRSYTPFIRQTVRAAGGLEPAPITGAEGLAVLRTIFGMYQAAETGMTQKLV